MLLLLFSCAERQTPCFRCAMSPSEAPLRFQLLTVQMLRSTAQRGAANLYTSSLRPWLAGMRLPWAQGSAPHTEPWSAHEHVVWASEKHTPEKAVALAATVPLVLECYLAVERFAAATVPTLDASSRVFLPRSLPHARSAAQADWMMHVVCVVNASPVAMPTSGIPPPATHLRLLQRMLCALHARTLGVIQARSK